MEFPVFIDGSWITWKPLPGLHISMGKVSFRIAAYVYAQKLLEGVSELKAHQLAEMALFEYYYRIRY